MQDKSSTLTPEVFAIVRNKNTEVPGTGQYCATKQSGTYLCRCCGIALFSSKSKFDSKTGWPSFDTSDFQNVTQVPDADGRRMEIICTRCQAHLGHVFKGENLTEKNHRYCVNSLALDLVLDETAQDSREAIFAGGCFWGIEYFLAKQPGVLKTECGYIGGKTVNPTYKQVCEEDTGHYEAVRILFNPNKTNFETLAKLFFEIHDPTQANGQGPDIGSQYLSAVFCLDNDQEKNTQKFIKTLEEKGLKVATKVLKASTFWSAENYHQAYYEKKGTKPYCHIYNKRF